MSTAVADTAALIPAALYARLRREASLAAFRQELSGIRFSIILLARWESSPDLDSCNRAELREELVHLRALYLETVDDLAMAFGVQRALETREAVERSVEVPLGMMPPLLDCEDRRPGY
jgi:hypothetical protein